MDKNNFISLIQQATSKPIKNDVFSMDMSDHSLVLVTAAGTIVGTPLSKCDESDLKEFAVDALFYTLGETYRKKIQREFIHSSKGRCIKDRELRYQL